MPTNSGCDRGARTTGRFVLFGEQHGTREAPLQFAETVCVAANRGPVIVGVEQPEILGPAFDAYLASADDQSATAALRAAYRGLITTDGRSSEAMFEMFARLRELKREGASIRVVPFQREVRILPDTSQTPYEQSMAAALLENVGHRDRVLVLVGSLHARREPVTFPGIVPFEPMAIRLPDTLTIFPRLSTATFWLTVIARPQLALSPDDLEVVVADGVGKVAPLA